MRNAFVIGHPISHSRSPLIHRYWLKEFGIPADYEAIDVAPEALEKFFARLRDGAFAGGNVTLPLKERAFALCDDVSEGARRIGAVNTLVLEPGEKGNQVHGRNTDLYGFLANLDNRAPGWDSDIGEAIVLGAGGASRAIVWALVERGIARLRLLNRTKAKAHELVAALDAEFPGRATAHALDEFGDLAPAARLVVNTTSIGMHGTRFDGLDLGRLPRHALVTDIVYVPLETPLLAEARALGLRTVDGLGMLLHQAVPGFEAWFGARPRVSDDLRTLVVRSLGG